MNVPDTIYENFVKLAADLWIDREDHSSTAGEDLDEVLRDHKEGIKLLGPWGVITKAGEGVYLANEDTFADACAKGIENMGDRDYAESPVMIVDLIYPKNRYYPHVTWEPIQWAGDGARVPDLERAGMAIDLLRGALQDIAMDTMEASDAAAYATRALEQTKDVVPSTGD